MKNFYIKLLGRQELGSPTADGTISRGRYIYISKGYGDFFPHLSSVEKNDSILLPIIPSFLEKKVYSTMVYHNDKYSTEHGTRDEFRLYLNKDIDPDRQYFQPGDIIVFQILDQGKQVPTYGLSRYNSSDSEYSQLASMLNDAGGRGGHTFVDEIPFLQERSIDIDNMQVVIPTEVKTDIIRDQERIMNNSEITNEDTLGASLFRSDSFRDFVMLAYQYRCAITGKSICYKDLINLEAAHIQPKAHSGTFLPCNGIALSRDMHWAFDKGFMTISDDYKIIVHEQMNDSMLNEYSNKSIFLPSVPYFQPDKIFLKHHREKVFGLFLHTGSIRKIP